MLLFRFRFPGFSPYSRPGFPCLLSGSVYLAFCLFPFILPCFTPTAVPQVLAWLPLTFRFPSALAFSPSFLLPFVRFFSGSDYSAFRFFFSLLPCSPSRLVPGASLSAFPSACFHASVPALVLSFAAIPFSVCCFASQRLPQHLSLLPFGFRPFPLS